MSVKTNLFGIHVGPLLDDLQGEGKLSGTGDVRIDLVTSGETQQTLKAALNGDVAINFRDGAVKGVNIAQSLRNAKAKLKGEKVDDSAPLSTDFSQMSASGKITNGVLQSDDLDMRSPLLRVNGSGSVDLNRDYVDYDARILITDDKAGQGGAAYADLAGLKLTLPVRGPFDNLEPDYGSALKNSIKDNLKDEQKEKLKKEEKRAKEKLKNKLKNLLD